MKLLIVDNDALVKLAAWDLLAELESFAGGWANIAVISSVPARIHQSIKKPGKGLARDHAAAVRLGAVLSGCADLPAPSAAVLSALQGVPGADAGETVLLGALHATPGSLFLTGDKRALAAFGTALPAVIKADIDGRVLCLEQFLHILCKQHGYQQITVKAAAKAPADITARIIFGSDGTRSEADVREGLTSYIGDLEQETAGLIDHDHIDRYLGGLDST